MFLFRVDLQCELVGIKEELSHISSQLEALLQQQEQLQERKKHIEELLQDAADKKTSQSTEWKNAGNP